ncbi:MAG TPA: 4Fe-4S dicluster domain-containing protein [bacterium]|nr:4Fe-4S dicluster domain-containing protein [bacterium]
MNENEQDQQMVWLFVLDRPYKVPAGLTIQDAMEYAGYKLTRGVGCRGGFCGACATVYRIEGQYQLKADLACQKVVEDGMHIVTIPFTPANKKQYDIDAPDMKADAGILLSYYPMVARCVSCNRCNNICPQELEVMEAMNAILQGDVERTARLMFDCIQCGLCSMRCPGEIPQFHIAQLARRLWGKYGESPDQMLTKRLGEITAGKFDEEYDTIMGAGREELQAMYDTRELKLA